MTRYFFDTSALAKRYHSEAGTPVVLSIFSAPDKEIRISKLSFVEFQSVFAGKVRTGVIDRDDAGLQRAMLMVDIAAGEMTVVEVTADHLNMADRLLGRYGFLHRLRTNGCYPTRGGSGSSDPGATRCFRCRGQGVVGDRSARRLASPESREPVEASLRTRRRPAPTPRRSAARGRAEVRWPPAAG